MDTSLTIRFPEHVYATLRSLGLSTDKITAKLKLGTAIELFKEGRISIGKAAEIAGMSRVSFMEKLKELDIVAYDFSLEDWQDEKKSLKEVLKK